MSNVSENIITQINQQTAEKSVPIHSTGLLKKGGKALLQSDTLGKCAPNPKYEVTVPVNKPVLTQPKKASETTNYLKAEVAAFVAAFLSDKDSVALSNSSLSDWSTLINTSSQCAIETTNSLIKKQKLQLTEYNEELAKQQHDEHIDKILGDLTLGLSIAIAVIAVGAALFSGGTSLAGVGAAESLGDAGTDAATETVGRRLAAYLGRNAVKLTANMTCGAAMGFIAASPKLVEGIQQRQLASALDQQANTEQQVGVLQASFSKQNEYLQYDGTQASVAGQLVQQLIQQLTGPITNIGDVVHAVQSAISKV